MITDISTTCVEVILKLKTTLKMASTQVVEFSDTTHNSPSQDSTQLDSQISSTSIEMKFYIANFIKHWVEPEAQKYMDGHLGIIIELFPW